MTTKKVKRSAALEVSEEQIRWFRARGNLLAGDVPTNEAEVLRRLNGVQAQELHPSLLALSQRMKTRPSRAELKARLLESELEDGADPPFVRTWGQRDTVHLYATEDWPSVVLARRAWVKSGRRNVMPSEKVLDACEQTLAKSDEPFTRDVLIKHIPKDVHAFFFEQLGDDKRACQYAAGRLIWCLAKRGALCSVGKKGSQQLYARRQAWAPRLDWTARDVKGNALDANSRQDEVIDAANVRLVRRYLKTFGPASVQDVSHHFGSRVPRAQAWLDALSDELTKVRCGERELVLLEEDEARLRDKPPKPSSKTWPPRLLPKYDTLLMGHADKSLLCPKQDEKSVWKKAANVEATLVDGGQLVAAYKTKATKTKATLTVTKLSGWTKRLEKALAEEAEKLGEHLGVKSVSVSYA